METDKQEKVYLKQIEKLCQLCHCDHKHAHQVKRLALSLFDQSAASLQIPRKIRPWLAYAALLHDIGWVNGKKRHHKKTLDIILSTPILDFENKSRFIIGSIARYHRKALPDIRHDHFAVLNVKEQAWVSKLAVYLRFANALDASHRAVIHQVNLKIKKSRIIVQCHVQENYQAERIKAEKCVPLLEDLFESSVKVKWIPT